MSDDPDGGPARFPERCAPRFVPIRPLGRGGCGTVWLAREVAVDREVAIKVLARVTDPVQIQRFRREAALSATFRHPHIVEVVDHDADTPEPWIAYEYIRGETLRSRIRGGPVPWRDALRIAIQLASALGYAHARGAVHRDVKPENVLEAVTDHHKLCDFGLAFWTDGSGRLTAANEFVGTPAYIAPDTVRGDPLGPAVDVYAVGVVLFELLTGAPPFSADHPAELLLKHLREPPPPARSIPGLPLRLERELDRTLSKNPGERHGDGGELAQALQDVMARASTRSVSGRVTVRFESTSPKPSQSGGVALTLVASFPRPSSLAGRPRRLGALASFLLLVGGVWMAATTREPDGARAKASATAGPPAAWTSLESAAAFDLSAAVAPLIVWAERLDHDLHRAHREREGTVLGARVRSEASRLVDATEAVIARADAATDPRTNWLELRRLRHSMSRLLRELLRERDVRRAELPAALGRLVARLRHKSPDTSRRIVGTWLAELSEALPSMDARLQERCAAALDALFEEWEASPSGQPERRVARLDLLFDAATRWRAAADMHAFTFLFADAARCEKQFCTRLRAGLTATPPHLAWVRAQPPQSAEARSVLFMLLRCADGLGRSSLRERGDMALIATFTQEACEELRTRFPEGHSEVEAMITRLRREASRDQVSILCPADRGRPRDGASADR